MSDSIRSKSFKGGSWLAIFKLMGQLLSWIVTVIVARILVPGDYGLFAMATLITGYAELFGELGLGNAIIQKKEYTHKELSSVFWFALLFSTLLAMSCFPIAYLTASIFDEPKIIPLTQAVSTLFIFSGLQIVPLNLLKKELEFKKVGFIEIVATFVSGIGMVSLAFLGAGVWTLVGGFIIRSFTKLVILYLMTKWYPKFYFSLEEAKSYIKFGLTMAFGRSLFYIWEQSDKYFAGRAWNSNLLGFYTFALELAQIPTEKIVVLINQISFPALSKLQDDKSQFNKFYLNANKITAFIVIPLFIGGFLVGEDIIKILLNEKWYPIITVFKYLCLTQILMAINAINNFVHAAQGRPIWGVYYHIAGIILMPISFYLAVPYGLEAIIIPWMTVFVFMCVIWIIISIKKIGVSMSDYIINLKNPVLGSIFMMFSVSVVRYLIAFSDNINNNFIIKFIISALVGAISYVLYQWLFDKDFLFSIKKLLKSKS